MSQRIINEKRRVNNGSDRLKNKAKILTKQSLQSKVVRLKNKTHANFHTSLTLYST
jgi:hypothetical protein